MITDLEEVYYQGKRFYKVKGEYYPSVTSILSINAEKQASLAAWERRIGKEEAERIRNYTARRGEIIHYNCLVNYRDHRNHQLWLELPEFLYDDPSILQDEQLIEEIQVANAMFKSWQREHTVKPLMIEQRIISYHHKYAGRIDFYGLIDDQFTILDIKSGSRLWEEEVAMQLGGYAYILCKELGLVVDTGACLRIHPDLENIEKNRIEFKWLEPQTEKFLSLRKVFASRNLLGSLVNQ